MKRSAAAALLSALVLACRSIPPAPPAVPVAADDPAVVAQIAAWSGEAREREALRGHARLAVDSADGRVRVRSKQLLVVRRPAQLRVEVLGFLNQTVAVVVTDGERFEVFRAQDRDYRSGEVGPTLLWDEAGIALTPGEAIGVLLGAPLGDPAWRPSGALREVDDALRVDWADADGALRQRVGFAADGTVASVERFAASGEPLWRARFDDYRDVGGSALAHAIALETGATTASIALSGVELNPPLDDDIFHLERPHAKGESGG